MTAYYGEIFAKARERTSAWLGSKLARSGTAMAFVFSLALCAWIKGIPTAVDEAGTYLIFGIAGPFVAWGLLFFVYFVRAPWLLDEDRKQEIANLQKDLAEKASATTPAQWAALRSEFEKLAEQHTAFPPCLDWSEGEAIVGGWRLRGGQDTRTQLESLARKGLKLGERSRYCESNIELTVSLQDPIPGWAELTRHFVPLAYESRPQTFYKGGEEQFYDSGSIKDPRKASILLCMELESRESD